MEVEAAFSSGLPWRRFNGWEPTTTTVTNSDGTTTTTREAEWNDEDRAISAAWIAFRNSICGGCGDSLIETTDPRMEGCYEPDGYVQCHKCVGHEQAVEPVENAVKANAGAHPRHRTYRYEIKRQPRRPLQ